MKIFHYCQHVLGMGHFFRSLEICKALEGEDIIFAAGGPEPTRQMPGNVEYFSLPALRMGENFGGLKTLGNNQNIESVKSRRSEILFNKFKEFKPDLFLIELFPFGRKAFRFELLPVLDAIKSGQLPETKVVCSLRDILVERDDGGKHERRCVQTLNDYFNLVLIHSDPKIARLEETFSMADHINPPLEYTGFVSRNPAPSSTISIREELGLAKEDKLIIASAGGGKVGGPLLKSVVQAFSKRKDNTGLAVFTGPFLDEDRFNELQRAANDSHRISIKRFTPDFIPLLRKADGLISMAGYNTCMDIMTTGVPALVHPFSQNREQRMRVEKISPYINIGLLEEDDLISPNLEARIDNLLQVERNTIPEMINLDGAVNSADMLRKLTGFA